jgi:nicotinate-nucleotide pyrophosphorylase (carboxylating)
MLAEDIGSGDITSRALVGSGVKAAGIIVAKQPGILAGTSEAAAVFRELKVKTKILKPDGSKIRPNTALMRLEGPARGILAGERVALNLLMRMSGIATATKELIDKAKRANPKVVISATRKTAPLLTHFDKRAVVVAGGKPHRYTLGEQVLIKDNHLKLVGSIEEALRRAKKSEKGKIEIEVSKVEDAIRAASAGADIVMLDNMNPTQIRRAIKVLEQKGLRGKIVLEASGGITPSNVGAFAATGVDVISTSYMTMRAPALDMSLEIRGLGR